MNEWSNISNWTKNIEPTKFENTYSDGTNVLDYIGGDGHERLYYPISVNAGAKVRFSLKFCSPTGFECDYGDTREYIAIHTSYVTGGLTPDVVKTPLDNSPSDILKEYTVEYTAPESMTLYCIIDFGFIVDGVQTQLIYSDISIKIEYAWEMVDGEIYNSNFISLPPDPMTTSKPDSVWRINPNENDGFPFNDLMISFDQIEYNPVYQPEYITIFDMWTLQDDFETNGLAVLTPISCTITEILNGEWTLSLEHPIDPDGKWQYILEKNIIKAMGQLFIIVSVDDSRSESEKMIRATAEHIFYEMNDCWIYPERSLYSRHTGQATTSFEIIDAAIKNSFEDAGTYPKELYYNYSYSGDVKITEAVALGKWGKIQDGCTPIDVILGDGGLTGSCGGELYRDNFYFSVNTEMENMEKDSFDIHIGHNLKGIIRTVDFSQFCGYFKGFMDGGFFAVSWAESTFSKNYPRVPRRSKNFSYSIDESVLPEGWTEEYVGDMKWQMLENDVFAYFNAHCAPIISYTVDIEDVRNNADYRNFSNNPRYKVGDTGRVYDERMGGYVTLRISKTIKDAITGKTIEVTFGDLVSFTRPSGYRTNIVDFTPEYKGSEVQLRDVNGDFLFDSDKNRLMQTKE